MSWLKHDDDCKICQERLMEAKAKAEEHLGPLDHISTRHEYTMQAWIAGSEGRIVVGTAPLTVQYSPRTQSVRIEVAGRAVNLDKAQFDDLRKVLHAFAFDPRFNSGAGERV